MSFRLSGDNKMGKKNNMIDHDDTGKSVYVTDNFRRIEFTCPCQCGKMNIDKELVVRLQELRSTYKVPLVIICGCRCKNYNKDIKGNKKSQHLLGIAADVSMKQISPLVLARAASSIPMFYNGGIGLYETYVHLDIRKTGKARWGKKWNSSIS